MDVAADLSLDDIIQKKYPKSLNRRGRGGGNRGRQRYQTGSNPLNKNAASGKSGLQVQRGGIQGRLGVGGRRGGIGAFPKSLIGDARSKITQQKRMKITDAREKLGEIAKQNDARQKLDRLRQLHARGRLESATAMNPLTMRGGIMAQTGRNGQLRLSTRKNRGYRKPKSPLGLQTIDRVISTDRRGVLSATIPSLLDLDTSMEEERPIIRRTVNNKPISSSLMFSPARQRDSFSSWMNSSARDDEIPEDNYGLASRRRPMLHSREPDLYASSAPRQLPQNFRVTARKTSPLHSPEVYYGSPTDMDIGYPEEDSPTPLHHNNSGNRVGSGVKARLDTPTVMRRTMGILAAESKHSTEAARTPTTHRIVVSNLQKSVTNEDIRELFEDIGSLVVSRLVRPGTAEVIYRTRKDAEKAVEIYHNRQLDGEPMKCMLVNPRSVPNSIGQTSVTRNISSSLAGGSNKFRSSSSKSQKLSVTPDVATIHKALFKRP